MKPLTRYIIISLILISCSTFFTLRSQTLEKKTETGSVSGNVTMKGKGVAGITVVLRKDFVQATPYEAKTDQDGHYRIINIPPGTYRVAPAAPQFAAFGRSGSAPLILGEGESVEDINFTLTKGGVITGRVTNSDGQPLIEKRVRTQLVEVFPNDTGEFSVGISQRTGLTDDRGVYRVFGLPPGKYKVSVENSGQRGFPGVSRRQSIPTTFYPDVHDSSKATIVDVSVGSEAANIDIKVGTDDTGEKFSVRGRVVDGVTGEPIAITGASVIRIDSGGGREFGVSSRVSVEGQFKVEGLPPGKYQLYVGTKENDEVVADPVQFEIISGDVNDLVVKTFKAVSVSGQIVFEGNDKFVPIPKNLTLMAAVNNSMGSFGRGAEIRQDGSFHVGALRKGTLKFEVGFGNDYNSRRNRLGISRIERDGVVQSRPIEVKDGDQVNGLRLFVNSRSGTIRGVLKFANGEIPRPGQVSVELTVNDPTRIHEQSLPSAQVDARGHFSMEGVPVGTYELGVYIYPLSRQGKLHSATQAVTVSEGVVSEVTITVDRAPGP